MDHKRKSAIQFNIAPCVDAETKRLRPHIANAKFVLINRLWVIAKLSDTINDRTRSLNAISIPARLYATYTALGQSYDAELRNLRQVDGQMHAYLSFLELAPVLCVLAVLDIGRLECAAQPGSFLLANVRIAVCSPRQYPEGSKLTNRSLVNYSILMSWAI
ncbi:hypothetical protein CLCR_05219 [Cladophialophora carrionii]|uniref:Uncharacterized protein n=1 Tax=Cladophialophora carrionii TaxID=86049 RepID=A0A1C1CL27_9EURO|nr:hypothetical protein CLCR_05219 [Cladophialophora carrionii]